MVGELGRSSSSGPRSASIYASYVGDRSCRDATPASRPRIRGRATPGRSGRPPSSPSAAEARRPSGRRPRAARRHLEVRARGRPAHGRPLGRRAGRAVRRSSTPSARAATPSTFVTLLDRDPAHPASLEHRLTYFAHADVARPDARPVARGPRSRATPRTAGADSPSDTLKCFGCHATATSDRGSGRLDEATMIPNVSCERCHGPARSHVEAARRGVGPDALAMPLGPGRTRRPSRSELCGECHRTPEMVTPGDDPAREPGAGPAPAGRPDAVGLLPQERGRPRAA